MKELSTLRRFSCILSSLILCAAIAPAQAATIAVTANAADALNGADASCSLREAITNINNGALTYADCLNTGAAYGTGDTINIPAGTYTTAIATTNEHLNANGDYDINKSVAIVGAGAGSTIIDGGAIDRVFFISGAYTVSISGVTIQNGNGTGGGGVLNNGGTTTITNSTISGNSAVGSSGGGIYNSGTLNVTTSTISGNGAANGGGVYNIGTVTVTNSTISGNSATNGGGGVSNFNLATVTNSTIVRNAASAGQGGGIYEFFLHSTVTNSIVADNGVGLDCSGVITNGGGSIDKDSSCGGFTHSATMVQGTGFSALAFNGGPTQTHALLAGSAAIDAGPATCAAAPVNALDQRGTARPQGSACDIGAYESDTIPTAFTFTAQTGVALSTVATSNTITVAGINSAANITIVGGTYSINGGAYTAVAGTVNNGDTVTVQQTSSGGFSTLTTATVTIGGVSGAFDVTTLAADTIPTAFTFTAQTGVALSTVTTSNTITVAGINSAAAITIAGAGGTYSKNGGAYTAVAGTVNNGDTVTVKQTSSGSFSTLTTATLTIGGVSGAFNVTTAAPVINGACGTANGVATAFIPSANLCTTGSASAVTAGSPWTWSCNGSGGGTNANCSAPNQTTGGGSGRAIISGGTWVVNPALSSGFIPSVGHAKSPPSLPPGMTFPYGLFDFTLTAGAAGSAATITITYPAALPPGSVYWKYGPSPAGYNCSGAGCAAPHWYQFPAVIAGNTATLTITDGGVGDDDLTANGVIVDQGGPGGGAASGIPTLSEWALLALAGLIGLFGMGAMRRRSAQ